MIGTERLKEIVALVERHGLVRTFELSESFGVTLSTVRRDLEVLEGEGLLRRVHGGAVSLRGRGYESPYPTRSVSNIDGKRAIARKAASFVSEGASIALDVGSTALQLAFELKAHRHLTVVTNNLRAAVELAEEPSHRVLVTGGLLRYGELSVVGHLAERVYTEFRGPAVLGRRRSRGPRRRDRFQHRGSAGQEMHARASQGTILARRSNQIRARRSHSGLRAGTNQSIGDRRAAAA